MILAKYRFGWYKIVSSSYGSINILDYAEIIVDTNLRNVLRDRDGNFDINMIDAIKLQYWTEGNTEFPVLHVFNLNNLIG